MIPEQEPGLITHRTAVKLSALSNLRYKMLLTEIWQIAQTPRTVIVDGDVLRKKLSDWAIYNEMRFIHQLSDRLNDQPLKKTGTGDFDLKAAAPFELPEKLPSTDRECWQTYVDVIDTTKTLINEIGASVAGLEEIKQADNDRRGFVVDRLR